MAKFSEYFKVVTPKPGVTTMADNQNIGDQGVYANYTWYQRLIQGSASRITRYRQYDTMDEDVEVSRALDTIAEEMIGSDPNSEIPLELVIQSEKEDKIPSSTVMTLRAALRYWCDMHDWDIRLFKVARHTIKYGDCFFIRKKETQKWEWMDSKDVVAAIVDDRDITRVIGWQMKRDTKVPNSPYNAPVGHFGSYSNELVDTLGADEVIRFTLNDDISEAAPFGESVLRAVYRAQKQKELLEDAIIIYRIQRAPERRVFYVDVGKMPPQRVKTYLEQIKNEIRQKKIPTAGGGVDQVDTVYNPQCLTLDTTIPLLDGRELTLGELIREFEQGKKNWAYSINPVTGEVVPGDISWAGVTRKNAQVIRLTLDNGQQLTCTPDHKIPVQGKGFVEAKDLVISVDSLFPFNVREQGLRNNKSKKYKQVYDTSKQDWVFVHRMVAETMQSVGMSEKHVFDSQYIESTMFDVVVDIILSEPLISLDLLIETINSNEAFMSEYHSNNALGASERGNVVFLSKIKTSFFSKHSLVKMLNENGYINFKTLRSKLAIQKSVYANHRVTEIEYLSETVDVGTITIDGCEHIHSHHTFAISAGIYVKNSMNEDFFFAQRPDGRGSKVEVLPGGQGLGELADLEYFQGKVFRGLRIPMSYMTEGSDGGVYNDGKTGVAYIQELRFALYIKRLQGYVAKVMDTEFKRYLKAANINIDTSIFSLKLPAPENFGIYRQQQLDSDLLNTFAAADGVPYLSKRFIMERYLQLTDEEILVNERMKREEMGINPDGGIEDYQQIYQPVDAMLAGGDLGAGSGMIAGAGGLGPEPGMPLDGSTPIDAGAGTPASVAAPTPTAGGPGAA